MNEKISIRVKYSVDDYVRVLTFMQNQMFLNKYGFVIVSAMIFIAMSFFIFILADDIDDINFGAAVFISLFPSVILGGLIYLLRKFLNPMLLKRTISKQYKSSPAMQEENSLVISDEGLESSNSLADGTIKWKGIIKALESETDFLFYTTTKFAHFVPKHIFASETDIDLIRYLSRAKLGDKAKF